MNDPRKLVVSNAVIEELNTKMQSTNIQSIQHVELGFLIVNGEVVNFYATRMFDELERQPSRALTIDYGIDGHNIDAPVNIYMTYSDDTEKLYRSRMYVKHRYGEPPGAYETLLSINPYNFEVPMIGMKIEVLHPFWCQSGLYSRYANYSQ